MQKEKGFILPILIIVFMAAVFGSTGYIVYKQYYSAPKPVACTMEAKLCPDGSAVGRTGPNCEFTPCPDPTANWQTYTNSQHGFEIKYPQDYIIKTDDFNKNLVYLHPIKNGSGTNYISNDDMFISIDKEPYTMLFQGTWSPTPYSSTKSAKIISSEDITANGISFQKDSWLISLDFSAISFNTNKNSTYYSIFWGIPNNENNIYNQIVSTFKFTK